MPQRQDACDTASPNVLNPSHLESLDQSYTVPYRFGPRRNPMPFRLITTPCGNVCFDHYTKGGFSHASEKEPCADLSGSFQSLTNRLQAHDGFLLLTNDLQGHHGALAIRMLRPERLAPDLITSCEKMQAGIGGSTPHTSARHPTFKEENVFTASFAH